MLIYICNIHLVNANVHSDLFILQTKIYICSNSIFPKMNKMVTLTYLMLYTQTVTPMHSIYQYTYTYFYIDKQLVYIHNYVNGQSSLFMLYSIIINKSDRLQNYVNNFL